MVGLIDEKKLREIFEGIMEVFKKHGLSKEESFYASQKFHADLKLALLKQRQRETASGLVNDMMGKFFGGR